MRSSRLRVYTWLAMFLYQAALAGAPASAQQINGVAGSSNATISIKGNQLPPPPMKFGGVIKESYRIPSRGGRRASCRPRALPTFFSS